MVRGTRAAQHFSGWVGPEPSFLTRLAGTGALGVTPAVALPRVSRGRAGAMGFERCRKGQRMASPSVPPAAGGGPQIRLAPLFAGDGMMLVGESGATISPLSQQRITAAVALDDCTRNGYDCTQYEYNPES